MISAGKNKGGKRLEYQRFGVSIQNRMLWEELTDKITLELGS